MTDEFTEEENKLIDRLNKTVMNRNVAKTLIFIFKKGETKSREIEAGTGLRQPEVSVAVNDLMENDWITKDEVKKEAKGRPVHHYTLKKDIDEIISEIEEREREKIDEIEENIQEIKKLVNQL
ncbi:MAG: ArsR family transcriptional regulator [Thermoplasmatota archaeon]